MTQYEQGYTGTNGHKAIDHDELARAWIIEARQGRFPHAPPPGKWYKVLASLLNIHETYGKDAMEATIQSYAQNTKSYPGFADLLQPKEQPESPPARDDTEEPLIPPLPESAQLSEDLSKDASPWLDEYETFSCYWSPRGFEDFHVFVGLWVLSTIAARRVRLDFGGKKYTPLFVALVARTTQYAKSTTAKIGYEALRSAGLRWMLGADNTTPQKLLSDMAGHLPNSYGTMDEDDQERARRRLAFSGQRGWYYDEFGQHMDAMSKTGGIMSDFKGILRRLDDCFDESEYATISRGSEKIDNPYLSLLASLTPSDIKPYAGANAAFWRDGFFARFAFVCPPADSRKRDRFPDGEMVIPYTLSKKLKDWHDQLGEPTLDVSDETNKKGDVTGYKWARSALPEQVCTLGEGVKNAYYAYSNGLDDLVDLYRLDMLAGNYGRLPMIALRIAMLLASLENNGVIEMRHWAKGQELAELLRKSVHTMVAEINQAEESDASMVENDVLAVVEKLDKSCTAREIRNHSRVFRRLSPARFRDVLDNLVTDGMLTREKPQGGKTQLYARTQPAKEQEEPIEAAF